MEMIVLVAAANARSILGVRKVQFPMVIFLYCWTLLIKSDFKYLLICCCGPCSLSGSFGKEKEVFRR